MPKTGIWTWKWWTKMNKHYFSPLRYAILAGALIGIVVILAYN